MSQRKVPYLCEYLCPMGLGIRQIVQIQSILCTHVTSTAAVSAASAFWLWHSNVVERCVLKCYINRRFVKRLINVLNVTSIKAFSHPLYLIQFRVMIWIRCGFQHIYHMLSVNLH